MPVRLYDSRRQAVVDLEPREPGRIGMYVCGPTVQSSPHVGHLRGALDWDLWRRWLAYRGFAVTMVRNVTDIDDKVLERATEEQTVDGGGEPWWALAYRIELEFARAYRAIDVADPAYEPRATGSIPQMLELIDRLIDRGHAYVADDGSGDVYFDVASWPAYGELTHQRPEDLADSPDADTRGKRGPRDFALWKGRKVDEPESASWSAPWGAGRPGWHIECSAMSRRYLGPEFDIHAGGLDLRFPHHENELAQSSAAGDPFARHWMHNGLVTVDGQKMSKSLGNSVFAADVLAAASPLAVRYWLAATHYRRALDYHAGVLDEVEAALDRIRGFLQRADRAVPGGGAVPVPEAFGAALDDDLGVPEGLAVLHDTVRAGNAALDRDDAEAAGVARDQVRAMTRVLGLDPTDARWTSASSAEGALGVLIEQLLADREAARADRDWAAADRIRDELADAGILVEDAADGARWSIA